ncbi:MAG: selenide, water dikinase SelD, partial [Bryobacterales bacterium]|nr:selenide, water dikinase SelD [Bryobacterales bacterium]
MQGGADKLKDAGCSLVGGHSIADDELKFGYAVTGVVHPKRFWRNVGAQPGDTLLLSKALGTGVISTAAKQGQASMSDVVASIDSMLELNRAAAEALDGLKVHACSDITGFGLLGHLKEMCAGGGITAEIHTAQVPLLPGALGYSKEEMYSGGLRANQEFTSAAIERHSGIDPALEALLCDPQTSGGLLVAIDSDDAIEAIIRHRGFHRIGKVVPAEDKPIRLAEY